MGRKIICPVCSKQFSNTRSFRRHQYKYFDSTTNTMIDHTQNSSDQPEDHQQATFHSHHTLIDPLTEFSTVENGPNMVPDVGKLRTQFAHHLTNQEDDHGLDNQEEKSQNADTVSYNDDVCDLGMKHQASDETEDSSNSEMSEDEDSSLPEIWNIEATEIETDLGIPKSVNRPCVNNLLFCFLYGILYFQAIHHISDNGLEYLLRFIFQFLNVIGVTVNNSFLTELCLVFPTSVYMIRKLTNLDRDSFKRYIVCPSCCKLYDLYECVTEKNGQRSANLCTKEHMHRGKSVKCNSPLMKQIVLKGGVMKFYPLKVFCYNSVISAIENILCRNGIEDQLEHWKEWNYDDKKLLRDIYDGKVWNDFLSFNSTPFLSDKTSLALMLNIDWFQPFKHRNYSVGVIYFVILNLPRQIRFKSENVIVAGLIPAMHKEPQLNSFLEPVVKELQILWKGVKLKSSLSNICLKFRAALLCVTCDIPAARKCCGFKSHAATLGCHKCFKRFPGSFGEKRNYSGFNDRQKWTPRTKQMHNIYARKVKNCKTKSQASDMATKYGTYYSVLIELEYFNAIQFCVIDPMHNLFLGTAKKVFKTWIEREVISSVKLETIEGRLREMVFLTDIGRIPTKISSHYGSFTADEWKNWTCIYSLYALCGIIPECDYQCWEKFVLACRLLCKPVLTTSDIDKADLLLLNFCKKFEELYGQLSVTPNMHLHCHLKECLYDYGPLHVYWCYSFERFNGVFGTYHTNNRSVEIQFMRNVVTLKHLENMHCNVEKCEQFYYFEEFFKSTLSQNSALKVEDFSTILRISEIPKVDFSNFDVQKHVSVPTMYKIKPLDNEDMVYLLGAYRKMYPSVFLDLKAMNEIIKKFATVTVLGERFGSKLDCRTLKSAHVLANWYGKDGEIEISDASMDLRPCRIDFFLSHIMKINGVDIKHVFAKVSWYKIYQDRFKYGKSLQLWLKNKFEAGGEVSFLPVQRIYSRFSCAISGRSKDLICVSPIPRHIINSVTKE